MARKPRLFVADMPYHVIQRGNNRTPIFFSDDDYFFFLSVLREAKIKHPCLIYGYCLMINHFHLLIQPKERDNISLFMKLLGAKYVRYVNKNYGRIGTLWQGRFKCSLIDKELYFITCLHYVEMNPLRAGIVNSPALYHWSSYRFRAYGEKNNVLDIDPWYNSLGSSPGERQLNYRQFFDKAVPESLWNLIREMTNKGGFVGDIRFKEQIEEALCQRIIIRPPGRPRRGEK